MKVYKTLPDNLARWAELQPIFFTGSASIHGPHVNVSPKGMDAHFAFLSPTQCAYIDRTGSGCETIAHAYENGRLCLMFTSFGVSPRILRLFCAATVVEWDQPAFSSLVRKVARDKREVYDGARAVILCDIWEATTSCGFGVPRVKTGIYRAAGKDEDEDEDGESDGNGNKGLNRGSIDKLLRQGPYSKPGEAMTELAVFEERPTLDKFIAQQISTNELLGFQLANNTRSLDGLPGLRAARREAGEWLCAGDVKARARRILSEGDAVAVGFLMAVFMWFAIGGAKGLL